MISALIEARSCERFKLLAEVCDDKELAKLYRGLWASEHGHYRTFIQLAENIEPADVVAKRHGTRCSTRSPASSNTNPRPTHAQRHRRVSGPRRILSSSARQGLGFSE